MSVAGLKGRSVEELATAFGLADEDVERLLRLAGAESFPDAKPCSRCQQMTLPGDFAGRTKWCKRCDSERVREYNERARQEDEARFLERKRQIARDFRARAGAHPRVLVPCGTVAAYYRHLRHGEKPCGSCKAARRQHDRDRRASAEG